MLRIEPVRQFSLLRIEHETKKFSIGMPKIELMQKFPLDHDLNTKLKNLQPFAKNRTHQTKITFIRFEHETFSIAMLRIELAIHESQSSKLFKIIFNHFPEN